MAIKLIHERLTETHDFLIRAPLRIKICTPFPATDRQTCQGVLENLFKTKKLDDARIDRRMETQPSLVRTECRIEFNTITLIDLDLALIVNPGNAEHDLAFRFNKPLNNATGTVTGFTFQQRFEGFQHFLDGLIKLGLSRA